MVELNTRDAGEAAGVEPFDTALPLDWYEDVHAKTGSWPQRLGFVWSYKVATVFGEPIPLSDEAVVCLRAYHAIEVRSSRHHSSLNDSSADSDCRTCAVINEAEYRLAEAAARG